MDGQVNDFFNEIDQIAPPKEADKKEQVWQECYDNGSGYVYYWNIKTDQVTWDMPEEYKIWKEQNVPSKSNMFLPPKSAPLFPSASVSTSKIYKIQEDSQKISNTDRKSSNTSHITIKSTSTTEADEKHVSSSHTNEVITAGKQTKSINRDKEEPFKLGPHLPDSTANQLNSVNSSDNDEEDNDDSDILTKIKNRARILKDLGGELPPDVKQTVEQNGSNSKTNKIKEKSVIGFSLVAGYGDSDEEIDDADDETKITSSHVIPEVKTKVACSTLFPVVEPITVKQFGEVKQESETIDIKAFSRKRRIGIDLIGSSKKSRLEPNVDDIGNEHQGLGFNSEKETENKATKTETKSNYSGFKSAGVMFVKSDVLQPTIEQEKNESIDDKTEVMKTVNNIRKTLNEKLTFLSEGREYPSPVQVMLIQMETLYQATKDGSLTLTYIHKWLKDTCSELVKLEKEAAPSGWLLQWDRENKRYFYRNQQTGESQWEYPQPDIVGGEDAMDISTTPPPIADDDNAVEATSTNSSLPPQPPPPPRIKSPTPPPPPSISSEKQTNPKEKSSSKPPPPLDESFDKSKSQNEPLPPGVESSEITSYQTSTEGNSNKSDSLGSALDSFYSDLAALETQTPSESATSSTQAQESSSSTNVTEDLNLKKKKKTKVKLAQGLAMKKKGVSKLVERWKNIQKEYSN